MAQSFQFGGSKLVQPGSYVDVKVQKQQSGLATSGVVFLVGEAESGPAWSQETDLGSNFFAPTELSSVIAKYKSGSLVDAFAAAANPANDTNITGAPSAIYCIKTNVGAKASANLLRAGLTNYGVLSDLGYGKSGNMLYASVSELVSEIAPDTGSICYIPGPETGGSDGSSFAVRVNGGAKQAITIAAQTTPTALVAQLNALSGVLATGGVDRGVLGGLADVDTLAVAVSGNDIVITCSVNWTVAPTIGDTLVIPNASSFGSTQASCIKGAADKNYGFYIVTASTATTISATKKKDLTAITNTAPEAVVAAAIDTQHTDIICYSPIRIQNTTGTGRSFLTGLVGKTIAGVASGASMVLTLQTGEVWAALPQANDFVFMPTTAPAGFLAAGNANAGWWRVTAATTGTGAGASTVTMTSLNNASPITFGATAIAAVSDLQCLRPDRKSVV